MIEIIHKNPYRLLGVYANSSTKERLANLTRIKAFLKVDKPISFPIDLSSILPTMERTSESVATADSQLTIPADQLHFAQFWFLKATPIDEIACNHLINGNLDNAVSFWAKKENASSLQNRIVCALISDDYSSAMACAEKLYSSFKTDFVTIVLGQSNTVDGSKIEFGFLDELAHTVGAEKIAKYITKPEWKQYVSKKEVDPLLNALLTSLDTAKESRGKGSAARLEAGKKLMTETRSALRKLKTILTSSDLQYQMIADKVGLEILQCGIDYYNDSSEIDAAKKSKELQAYALSIVVGQMAKDRCQENVNILNDIISKMPPEEVWPEIKMIETEIQKFSKSLPDCKSFLNNTHTSLNTIESKLGSNNPLYLRLSTQVVDIVLDIIINEVNKKFDELKSLDFGRPLRGQGYSISIDEEGMERDRETILKSLEDIVCRQSLPLIHKMDLFDMEQSYKDNRYSPNRSTFMQLYDQAQKARAQRERIMEQRYATYKYLETHPIPRSSSSNSGGCYIATMVYGDYNHPQVMALREFRDEYLAVRGWGRRFIKFYYKYSPRLVEKLKDHKAINVMIKGILDKFIIYLKDKKQKSQREKC